MHQPQPKHTHKKTRAYSKLACRNRTPILIYKYSVCVWVCEETGIAQKNPLVHSHRTADIINEFVVTTVWHTHTHAHTAVGIVCPPNTQREAHTHTAFNCPTCARVVSISLRVSSLACVAIESRSSRRPPHRPPTLELICAVEIFILSEEPVWYIEKDVRTFHSSVAQCCVLIHIRAQTHTETPAPHTRLT